MIKKGHISGRATASVQVLFLCDAVAPGMQNAILDHIEAFASNSRLSIVPFNPRSVLSARGFSLRGFDVVVIHFSLCALWDNYLPPPVRDAISAFSGLKIQFVQDEYRYADLMSERMVELGIDIVFTLADDAARKKIYRRLEDEDVRFIRTATAYVPANLIESSRVPIESRRIALSYRAREVPFWWGALAQDKVRIAETLAAKLSERAILTDIDTSTESRITGKQWIDFLKNSKAVLVTQSGTSITDYDGSVEEEVEAYMIGHPGAPFDEVARNVLKPYEGNVRYVAPSPKILEATALGCALVMTEGEHGYGLIPGVHYFELREHASNLDDLIAFLSSDEKMQQMADAAYDRVISSGKWSYRRFIEEFDDVVVAGVGRVPGNTVDYLLPSPIKKWGLNARLNLLNTIEHWRAWLDLMIRSYFGFVAGRGEVARAWLLAFLTPVFWALARERNVGNFHLLRDIALLRYGVWFAKSRGDRCLVGKLDPASGLLRLSIVDKDSEDNPQGLEQVSAWFADRKIEKVDWENGPDWQDLPKPIRFSNAELHSLASLSRASMSRLAEVFRT